ncbi:hypothetical protein HKM21_18415 [Longimicrobium terrae]|nr:hypothetical protein [Longimicrobium terrae]
MFIMRRFAMTIRHISPRVHPRIASPMTIINRHRPSSTDIGHATTISRQCSSITGSQHLSITIRRAIHRNPPG